MTERSEPKADRKIVWEDVRVFRASLLPRIVIIGDHYCDDICKFVAAYLEAESRHGTPMWCELKSLFEPLDGSIYNLEDGKLCAFRDHNEFTRWLQTQVRTMLDEVYDEALEEDRKWFLRNPDGTVREFLAESREFHRRKLPECLLDVL